MIEVTNGLFHISTDSTSYIFTVDETGYPEQVYWGRRLKDAALSLPAIREKHLKAPVMSTITDRSIPDFTLDDTLLEFSTEGRGDYRTPFVAVSRSGKGDRTLDLRYSGHAVKEGITRFTTLRQPQAVGSPSDAESLEVYYTDRDRGVTLTTIYTAFTHADTITRRSVITNDGDGTLLLRSLASAQFDIRARGCTVTTFSGAWGREKREYRRRMVPGTITNEARTVSSGMTDPAVFVSDAMDTYLFSLVYSGAHRTTVTETENGITHIVTGINSDTFSWSLEEGESFESPEAVLIHSGEGEEKASARMHKFIERHIRRGMWRDRMKPVMLNTWETLGFGPDEGEIHSMAKDARDLGMDGIVVEDGWFGARDSDRNSLGDWFPDTRHFPSGMKELSEEVHYMGLMFGLWFEIEGVSERSRLFREHSDWVVGENVKRNAEGRYQQLLDFSRTDVQEWAASVINDTVESAHVDYIRLGFSRFQSDVWSHGDTQSGEWMHRYITGLYAVLDTVIKTHPDLYVESASRGGLRMDLGMLSYSSTIRLTECSDPVERVRTMEGAMKIYPASVFSTLITGCPDRYTRRDIPLETRFNISAFSVLQYSVNPREMTRMERNAVRQQLDFYKAYRPLLQYGKIRVQEDGDERTIWSAANGDSSVILLMYLMKRAGINTTAEKLRIDDANPDYTYAFSARLQFRSGSELLLQPQEPEIYKVGGDALRWAGISLNDNISGNGYADGMRTLLDSSSRLYIIRRQS